MEEATTKTKERAQIKVDKDFLEEKLRSFEEIRSIEVPEFGKEGEPAPFVKIKMASLDDQIKARELSGRMIKSVLEIFNKVKDGKEITEQDFKKAVFSEEEFHPKTQMEIILFKRNVIEPKFSLEEVIRMSENPKLADVINRVCSIMLGVEE